MIELLPDAVDAFKEIQKKAGGDEKEREELSKALEQRKIDSWTKINVFLVYDWSTEEVIAMDSVTDAVLRKASTSVYVNTWTLTKNPGRLLVSDKLPPEGFADSYGLYTGKIDELLRRFTESKAK